MGLKSIKHQIIGCCVLLLGLFFKSQFEQKEHLIENEWRRFEMSFDGDFKLELFQPSHGFSDSYGYSDSHLLQEAINCAKETGVGSIEIRRDMVIDRPISIPDGIRINGNNHTLSISAKMDTVLIFK